MKLIRTTSTKIVKLLMDDNDPINLTSNGLKVNKNRFLDIKSTNSEIIENIPIIAIPTPWFNNGYTYDIETGFVINSVGESMLEEYNNNKKIEAIQKLASYRYNVEISGVLYTEDTENYILYTNRESVQLLDSYAEKLRRGLLESVNWKCNNNQWLTINLLNIDAIELLILTHIQTCFELEKSFQSAIMTDPNINIYTGWPTLSI